MAVAKRNKRVIPDRELVKLANSLLENCQAPEDLIGEDGLLQQLTRMLVERALETEMSEHLGHGKSEAVTNSSGKYPQQPQHQDAARRVRGISARYHA